MHVLPPTKILFDDSKREAQVGTHLQLAISLYTTIDGKEVAVDECDQLPFEFSFEDNTVFQVIKGYSQRTTIKLMPINLR